MNTNTPNAERTAFTSRLGEGRQRFIAEVVDHSLASGQRSARDFMRHFPPDAIMAGLADQPKLRANIVVPTIGIHEKVALKKSAASLGEDLRIAMDEEVTDPESIVALFDPDDRVRYLDERRLWGFVVEGDFWKATQDESDGAARAKALVAFIVACARANELLSDQEIVDGCTVETLVERLPKAELAKILMSAIQEGRAGKAFRDEDLLRITPPSALLDHLPLADVWDTVVAPLADRHGFGAGVPMERRAPPLPPLARANPPPRQRDDGEVVDAEKPPERPRTRRIGALDLTDLKSEVSDAANGGKR